eukprot:5973566-Amphidinium_carterae.1
MPSLGSTRFFAPSSFMLGLDGAEVCGMSNKFMKDIRTAAPNKTLVQALVSEGLARLRHELMAHEFFAWAEADPKVDSPQHLCAEAAGRRPDFQGLSGYTNASRGRQKRLQCGVSWSLAEGVRTVWTDGSGRHSSNPHLQRNGAWLPH